MIDAFLASEDWEEAPETMAFVAPYQEILREVVLLVGELSTDNPGLKAEGATLIEAQKARCLAARRLYIMAPALVNVALNYKICAEHGLPLHPTVYYELTEADRYDIEHPLGTIDLATRIYRASIQLARSAYRLDPDFGSRAETFAAMLPPEIGTFLYTGGQDRYSWRGSDPAKLGSLAAKVRASYSPDILVAAAHGAIMPALLLAEYLQIPLYFIRFSMFKRQDEAPILSIGDELWLSGWREKRALLFDEDVAGGTTLRLFSQKLSPLFAEAKSAACIRHAGAGFSPDFVAYHWWE